MLNGIMFYTKIYRQIHGDRVSDRGTFFLNAKDTLQKNENMTPPDWSSSRGNHT